MDLAIFYFYGLIIIIGIGIFMIAGILGFLILKIVQINKKRSREYMKNITYSIVGGIIAVVLLELRGNEWENLLFYLINVPISIGIIFLFILIGFWYLHMIDKIFDFFEKEIKQKN